MSVIRFTYDKQLTKEFIELGFELNEDDKKWIPPFREELQQQLSKDFEFNRNQGNSHCNFIATRNGKILARLSAMKNKNLIDKNGNQIGTIGFFECINDMEVAKEILNDAVSFLVNENGINKIYGPMNFDIWHGYRFMTKGFEREIFPGEPYNKPYYNEMFIKAGFKAIYSWDSTEVENYEDLIGISSRGKVRFEMLKEIGYTFEDLDSNNLDEQLINLYNIINISFNNFFAYTEIDLEEFTRMYSGLRHSTKPGFFSLIYDEAGLLSGFTGVLVDESIAIRAMRGNKGILSKVKFSINKPKADRAVFYVAGITPEQIQKHSGLGRAGFYYGVQKAIEAGYDKMVFALMAKDQVVHGLLGKHANKHDREYTLYELQI